MPAGSLAQDSFLYFLVIYKRSIGSYVSQPVTKARRCTSTTTGHIPGATSPVGGVNLERIYGASGWACTSTLAKTDIKNYGFRTIPTCGTTSYPPAGLRGSPAERGRRPASPARLLP